MALSMPSMPTFAEAAGDEDAIEALELRGVVGSFEAFGFEPGDAEF